MSWDHAQTWWVRGQGQVLQYNIAKANGGKKMEGRAFENYSHEQMDARGPFEDPPEQISECVIARPDPLCPLWTPYARMTPYTYTDLYL